MSKGIRIDYLGGSIMLRPAGTVMIDGKEVTFKDAIKISHGAINSQLSFEAFVVLVEAHNTRSEVREFLERNGVHLKKGIF